MEAEEDPTAEFVDQLSMMPDEILISVLSLLDTKEAAKTCVLSRRWRHLWTSVTRVNFDESRLVFQLACNLVKKSRRDERLRFVYQLNRCMKSLSRRRALEGFKVCFDVGEVAKGDDVESWIGYALERRVSALELDLTPCDLFDFRGNFTVTTKFLRGYAIDSLKTIRFNCVEMTAEVIDHLFLCCPLLEALCVANARTLARVKVPGPSPRLKRLEITRCDFVESVEVSAVNLVSFVYCGKRTDMSFEEVPCLSEASFTGPCIDSLVKNGDQFFCTLSRLQTLTLGLQLTTEVSWSLPQCFKLMNLKQLKVMLIGGEINRFDFGVSMLKACPLLRTFLLMFQDPDERPRRWMMKLLKSESEHRWLEEVEFVGFSGHRYENELVQYLVNRNIASLKRLIIDPKSPVENESEWPDFRDPQMISSARDLAKQLQVRLPPEVQLVIL